MSESLPDLTGHVDAVVTEVLVHAPQLTGSNLMIVGAVCRDLLHHRQGHDRPLAATSDLDLAIALDSWAAFESLTQAFERIGETGIRHRIAGIPVDLLAFGGIEEPDGIATPPTRHGERMGVWALAEVFAAADDLVLVSGAIVKIPTTAGYAAAKVGAWVDRSRWLQARDARDLALSVWWYVESADVRERLYSTEDGVSALLAEQSHEGLAAARLLGRDVAALVGSERLGELSDNWPGDERLLVREFTFANAPWGHDEQRRSALVRAFTGGLGL